MIAYVTDLEGRWDKLASFATENPYVSLDGDRLILADGVTFVFGGDAVDRGPHARRIVRTLLAAKRAYGDRVVLIAGNRDINKMRLIRELRGEPPKAAPAGTRGEVFRWILTNTMGARQAFDHRATEIAATSDDEVVDSYLADLEPAGELRAYLEACQLAFRAGSTLILHGGATPENLTTDDVDAWVAGLNRFYGEQMAASDREKLIAYQAPIPRTSLNQSSVVYARLTDPWGNPNLPQRSVIDTLRANHIARLVVGHTPSGDSPAIVRDPTTRFELVMADNSYGRVERGSQLAFDDTAIHVRGTAKLDDGTIETVAFSARLDEVSPLGLRDATTGHLVKSRLGDGYLVFKGLPEYRFEQLAASAGDIAKRFPVAPP